MSEAVARYTATAIINARPPFDTSPGSLGIWAPEAGYQGNAQDYREIIRARWKHNPSVRQQIQALLYRFPPNRVDVQALFSGAFAEEAARIYAELDAHYDAQELQA